MLVLVMSYKKNGKWNPTYNYSKKRFTQMGYTVKPIEGYNLKEHPEIKPNQVVYLNLKDKVLPYLKENLNNEHGVLVAEDDAYISDILTPEFLKNKLKKNGYKNKIIRIGYQKVLKQNKKKRYPRGYFCVGNQLIWFPTSQISRLESELNKQRPQHLNGFLSINMKLNIKLLDHAKQIHQGEKYVNEIEHVSATTKKVRKGMKLTKKVMKGLNLTKINKKSLIKRNHLKRKQR